MTVESVTIKPQSNDSRPETWEHIHRVRELMQPVIVELLIRSTNHDASKLISPEVEAFDEVVGTLKELTYGSVEYIEALHHIDPALQHHYEFNTHHPQHYAAGVDGMTLMDLCEMICDWKAASERGKDNNFILGLKHNKTRYHLSDQLFNIIVNTALALGYDK